MAVIRQPLGGAILNVLGFGASLIPQALLRILRDKLDREFWFELGVSVRLEVPCTTAAVTPGGAGTTPGSGGSGTPSGPGGSSGGSPPAGGSGVGGHQDAEDGGPAGRRGRKPRRDLRQGRPKTVAKAPDKAGGPVGAPDKEKEKGPPGEPSVPVGEGRSRSSPNHCCRIIINPGRDTWPVQSPKLTVGPETSIDIEANAAGIGGITIGLSLKLTPDLIDVSPRGNCPAECGDESMRIGVSVVFEGEVTLRGQLLSLDGGAGAANFGTTEADLGPLFGKANLNGGNIPNDPPPPGPGGGPGIAGVGGVGLRRRLRKPAESFTYSVVCDSITRVMPGATPANTGGATTPGASSATPGGSTPASVPRDPQCPDPNLDAIVADSDMSQEFDRAWTRSRPNAPDVPHNRPGSQKREWGGWVILNARTGKYRFDSRGPGSRDELDLAPIPNVTYPECLMCWFHTHPNKRSEGYEPDASVTDVITYNRLRFPDGRRVPMLIRSHEGYHKYSHDF